VNELEQVGTALTVPYFSVGRARSLYSKWLQDKRREDLAEMVDELNAAWGFLGDVVARLPRADRMPPGMAWGRPLDTPESPDPSVAGQN
jgi:hypothetical protein